jgi:DNA polymerase
VTTTDAPVRRSTNDDAAALAEARDEAEHCRDCPLWKDATQTVFGEGAARARLMLVGEQPGDQEDIQGRPFVGPAGGVLDRALSEAGIDRREAYVTNAVKHFKFEPRGKKRIHKKPADREIVACHQWLDREIASVRPDLVVALGATAARALTGRVTAIERNRGKIIGLAGGPRLLIAVHPSMLLRIPPEYRDEGYRRFVADLKLAARFVSGKA